MIEFIESPASKKSLSSRKPIFGMGINDADYMTGRLVNGKNHICPYYRKWSDMIQRCYDPKLHKKRPSYIGCEPSPEWMYFSNFKKWMKDQKWHGLELDKDIKFIGNKIYSADTCLFITREVNLLFNTHAARGKALPVGVNFLKTTNNYQSRCSYKGKLKYLGVYKTPEAAYCAYKSFKKKVIIETANQPENANIKEYLMNHADLMHTTN